MVQIRITSAPPGFPPKKVREGWVGITLTSSGRERELDLRGRIGTENLGGYVVEAPAAMEALRVHNPDAYAWWKEGMPELCEGGRLIFKADVCEEVASNQA